MLEIVLCSRSGIACAPVLAATPIWIHPPCTLLNHSSAIPCNAIIACEYGDVQNSNCSLNMITLFPILLDLLYSKSNVHNLVGMSVSYFTVEIRS